jgi:hypothetical protein
VIGVVWTYTGLPPDQMAGRMITPFQRALTTTVNDIEHIVANSYNGIGIVKIFFQPNVDIRIANAQVTAISQTMIRQMPPGATPPLVLNYSASTGADHPGRAVRRGPHRTEPRRYRHQPAAHAAGDGAGCGDSLSVRRQAAPGPDRSQSRRRCRRAACPGRMSPTRWPRKT